MTDNIEFPEFPEFVEPETVAEVEELPSPTPPPPSSYPPPPVPEAEPTKGHIPQFIVGLIMIGALLAAAVAVGQHEAPKPKDAPPTAGAAPAPAAAEAPAAAPAATSEAANAEIKELKTALEGLSAQVKGLQEKLDGLPKPGPAADTQGIQGKIDELAKSVAQLTPITEKVGKFTERMDGFETSLKSANDEVSKLATDVKKLSSGPAASESTASTEAPKSPADLTEGINLFKAGKYKEAGEAFKKVEAESPNDARIYYYEAFVNGLTTSNWQGETLKIAAKAASLEKTGATKAADIDAAFTDLPANLKPWLAYFRKQVN